MRVESKIKRKIELWEKQIEKIERKSRSLRFGEGEIDFSEKMEREISNRERILLLCYVKMLGKDAKLIQAD